MSNLIIVPGRDAPRWLHFAPSPFTGGPRILGSNPGVPTTISPTSMTQWDGATTLTVTGTGFGAATVIFINSVAYTTTFVNSTSVTCSVPDSLTSGSILRTNSSYSVQVGIVVPTSTPITLTVAAWTPTSVSQSYVEADTTVGPHYGGPTTWYVNDWTDQTVNGRNLVAQWGAVESLSDSLFNGHTAGTASADAWYTLGGNMVNYINYGGGGIFTICVAFSLSAVTQTAAFSSANLCAHIFGSFNSAGIFARNAGAGTYEVAGVILNGGLSFISNPVTVSLNTPILLQWRVNGFYNQIRLNTTGAFTAGTVTSPYYTAIDPPYAYSRAAAAGTFMSGKLVAAGMQNAFVSDSDIDRWMRKWKVAYAA